MKNSRIKKLAQRAKNRMLGRGVCEYNNVCVKVVQQDEEEFILRAKEVFIKSEKDCSYNPIKMLLDEKILQKLDERGREKYLLETMDKYLKAKKDFLRDIEFC